MFRCAPHSRVVAIPSGSFGLFAPWCDTTARCALPDASEAKVKVAMAEMPEKAPRVLSASHTSDAGQSLTSICQ